LLGRDIGLMNSMMYFTPGLGHVLRERSFSIGRLLLGSMMRCEQQISQLESVMSCETDLSVSGDFSWDR
jgi:hypothetical protein